MQARDLTTGRTIGLTFDHGDNFMIPWPGSAVSTAFGKIKRVDKSLTMSDVNLVASIKLQSLPPRRVFRSHPKVA